MSYSRSDQIALPDDEPRCHPQSCTAGARCARRVAAIPRNGAMRDYSLDPGGGTVLCHGYVSIEGLRRKPAQQIRPIKDWPT